MIINNEGVTKILPGKPVHVLSLGNVHMSISKKLNFFQKLMWRIFFGITVHDYKGD